MRPSALLVDCYGTLVAGDRPAIEAVVANVVGRTGLDGHVLDRAWWQRFRQLCATSSGDGFERQRALELRAMAEVLRSHGVDVPSAELEVLLEPLFYYWRTARPLPDALALLRRWTVCPVVIVSNIDRGDVEQVWADLPGVDAVVTSEDARAYKPDRTVFQHALAVTGLAPDRVVHVGDSWESDVQGALRAGITPVWLNRVDRNRKDPATRSADVACIASLDEVPACLARLPERRMP